MQILNYKIHCHMGKLLDIRVVFQDQFLSVRSGWSNAHTSHTNQNHSPDTRLISSGSISKLWHLDANRNQWFPIYSPLERSQLHCITNWPPRVPPGSSWMETSCEPRCEVSFDQSERKARAGARGSIRCLLVDWEAFCASHPQKCPPHWSNALVIKVSLAFGYSAR